MGMLDTSIHSSKLLGGNKEIMMDNGPAATMPMGSNGLTVRGNTANVPGPAMAKAESKGPNAREQSPLKPASVK